MASPVGKGKPHFTEVKPPLADKCKFMPKDFSSANWYRVHKIDKAGDFAANRFNDSGKGNARFSPLRDPVSNKVIPTIYAASTEKGAICEILLHDVPIPSTDYQHDLEGDMKSELYMSAITIPRVNLVDLTWPALKGAGLHVSDLFDGGKDDYDRTREWALHIWKTMPDVQGLYWMSRQHSASEAVMLFGERMKDPVAPLGDSVHISKYANMIVELVEGMGAMIGP